MDVWPYVHDYREFESYQKAREWYDGFEPQPGRDYVFAHDFATKKWSEVNSTIGLVDGKADGFLKFSAAGVPIILAAMPRLLVTEVSHWLMLASLAMFTVSAILAMLSRRGAIWPSPMETRDLLEYDEPNADLRMAVVAASLHVATIGTAEHVKQKSKILNSSIACVVAAVVLFALSVGFASQASAPSPPAAHSIREKTL